MQKTVDLPIQTRAGSVGNYDETARTVPVVWTTGAAVPRCTWEGERWIEELSTDPAHVRMGRLNSGAPVLDSHNQWRVAGVIGVVEGASIAGGEGTATLRFSARDEVKPIIQDVKDKIIRNVSVGYRVYRYEDVSTAEDIKARARRLRAVDWEPTEISLVPVGADPGAGVRGEAVTYPCDVDLIERSDNTAGQLAPPASCGGVSDLLRRDDREYIGLNIKLGL